LLSVTGAESIAFACCVSGKPDSRIIVAVALVLVYSSWRLRRHAERRTL